MKPSTTCHICQLPLPAAQWLELGEPLKAGRRTIHVRHRYCSARCLNIRVAHLRREAVDRAARAGAAS